MTGVGFLGISLLRKQAGSRVEISKVPIPWPIYRVIRGDMALVCRYYRKLGERPSIIPTLKFVAIAAILGAMHFKSASHLINLTVILINGPLGDPVNFIQRGTPCLFQPLYPFLKLV